MKWICLLLFGSVGSALFIPGMVWGWRRYSLMREGVRAVGTIVDMDESVSTSTEGGRSRTSRAYYPFVEFAAADGKTHRFRGSTGSGSATYQKGEQVDLVYRRDNPSEAQITDFEQFWLGPLAISLFGFLFIVGGVGGFFLIADSDRVFGPAFEQAMARHDLVDGKRGMPLTARVAEIKTQPGDGGKPEFVLVCRALTPDGQERVYESVPIFFDPSRLALGRSVVVYVDPADAKRYYVAYEELLKPRAPGAQ